VRNKKAEIGTALMVVALVVMTLIGFSSSTLLSKKQTTSTKAAGSGCEAASGEVHTPSGWCSATSLSSNHWNYCLDSGYYEYPVIAPHNCDKRYADNLTKTCYTTDCCDESTASNLGYSYNGIICGSGVGQTEPETTNPAGGGQTAPSSSGGADLCANHPGYPNGCCVQDKYYCNGEYRYRWYGCTQAPCEKTIISTFGGPGHLINCPYGMTENSNPDGVCQSNLPQQPQQPPSDGNQKETPPDSTKYDCQEYLTNRECSNECSSPAQCLNSSGGRGGRWCCTGKSNQGGGTQSPAHRGNLNEPCLYTQRTDPVRLVFYCNDGLVCSNQTGTGICQQSVANLPGGNVGTSSTTPGGNPPAANSPGPINNLNIGTTCQVNKTKLSVSGQDITVENNNDLWTNLPCNHILLKSVNNISVFRECPSWIQGNSCVYSCYKDSKQVNCEHVYDVQTNRPSITFINNKSYDIWLKAASETNPVEIIFSETKIPTSQYIQGFYSCVGVSGPTIDYLYKDSEDGQYNLIQKINVDNNCLGLLISIQ